MKNFWKATIIPGLCCIFAGAVLAVILAVGFSDELMKHANEFIINEDNFFEYFDVHEVSINRTNDDASYYFEVQEMEAVSGLHFEVAVGEVEIRTGDTMEITVVDMYENAITSEVRNGIWYIEDSLINNGKVNSDYSPEITITIPENMSYDSVEIYLAAGIMEADELAGEKVSLEVDAGSLKIYNLRAEEALTLKNGVGEIRVYDAMAANLSVDNGIGAVDICGNISGHNTVKCGTGEVKVSLTDRNKVDFNYSVDCGIGEVEIDGRSYQGNSENLSYDRSEADYFELDCGIGHIEINISGN